MFIQLLLVLFCAFPPIRADNNQTWVLENEFYGTSAIDMSADGLRMALSTMVYPADTVVQVYELSDATWSQLGDNIGDPDKLGQCLLLSADGSRLAASTNQGVIRVYDLTDDASWTEIGTITGDATAGFATEGRCAMSGDGSRIAVGAPLYHGPNGEKRHAGQAQVFEFQSDQWQQIGQTLEGEASYGTGKAVTLSGNGQRLAVSDNSFSGTGCVSCGQINVYDFKPVSNSWELVGEPILGSQREFIGYTVSLSQDGTQLAIGSFADAAIRIYEFQNTAWTQLGTDIPAPEPTVRFGETSIALAANGGRILVSSTGHDQNKGMGRLYEFMPQDDWELIKEFKGKTPRGAFSFDLAISADGKQVAIGSRNDGIRLFGEPTDCVGQWGDCDNDTCQETFSVSQVAVAGGNSCNEIDGQTQPCQDDTKCYSTTEAIAESQADLENQAGQTNQTSNNTDTEYTITATIGITYKLRSSRSLRRRIQEDPDIATVTAAIMESTRIETALALDVSESQVTVFPIDEPNSTVSKEGTKTLYSAIVVKTEDPLVANQVKTKFSENDFSTKLGTAIQAHLDAQSSAVVIEAMNVKSTVITWKSIKPESSLNTVFIIIGTFILFALLAVGFLMMNRSAENLPHVDLNTTESSSLPTPPN